MSQKIRCEIKYEIFPICDQPNHLKRCDLRTPKVLSFLPTYLTFLSLGRGGATLIFYFWPNWYLCHWFKAMFKSTLLCNECINGNMCLFQLHQRWVSRCSTNMFCCTSVCEKPAPNRLTSKSTTTCILITPFSCFWFL